MFHTAVRCPISSMATLRMARRQRAVASASAALSPSSVPLPQAERRVQIGAHQVVLELGGFVQLVYQRLARDLRFGHDGVSVLTHRRQGSRTWRRVIGRAHE